MTKLKNKTNKQGNKNLKNKSVKEKTKEKKSTSTVTSNVKQQPALKKNKLNKVEKIKTKSSSKQTIVKGDSKQGKWIEHFRSYLKNIKSDDGTLQSCITAFLKTDSIPRKESKFKNYLSGSFKLSSETSSKVWEAVKGAFELDDNTIVQPKEAKNEQKGNGKSPAKKTNIQQMKKNQKRPVTVDEAEEDDQIASSQSPAQKKKASQNKKK